ncbi:MAG TPA: hypothetical protein VEI02_12815 [Planctomycetota bacterium]|nr:hypothetical protein [Planctomycetota bacterium]
MAEKKLFGKVRKAVVVGALASLGAGLGGCSSTHRPADRTFDDRRMDFLDPGEKRCGGKHCAAHKSCGHDGSKSCGSHRDGSKSCGSKSCG